MSNNKKDPHYIRIRVYDMDTKLRERNLRSNFGCADTRKWLSNLVLWATQNNKGIEIVKDNKQPRKKTSPFSAQRNERRNRDLH